MKIIVYREGANRNSTDVVSQWKLFGVNFLYSLTRVPKEYGFLEVVIFLFNIYFFSG